MMQRKQDHFERNKNPKNPPLKKRIKKFEAGKSQKISRRNKNFKIPFEISETSQNNLKMGKTSKTPKIKLG
jgi:hypothetical protein